MAFEHPAAVIGWARLRPNLWDLVAFALVFGVLILLGQAGRETLAPLASVQQTPISLDPAMLPEYGLRTTLRMLAAILASLLFTLTYGALAAKSRRAELVLVPLLDILQSVPVLGFLSFTVVGFMALVPGRVLGVELAAVFAIFTSQAWNMAFSFYQSLKTVPHDLEEASRSFRLSAWQRFWRLEVPFAMPGLVWNTMMSMSGGWFFVVASEAITVGDTTVSLPGIGSYLARAINDENLAAVGWAVLAMLVIILVYDQLLFRPLVAWAEKFRFEQSASATRPSSWMLSLVKRTQLARTLVAPIGHVLHRLFSVPTQVRVPLPAAAERICSSRWVDAAWMAVIAVATVYALWRIEQFVTTEVTLEEFGRVVLLGTFTMIRVIVLIAIATLIWVPVGVLDWPAPARCRDGAAYCPVSRGFSRKYRLPLCRDWDRPFPGLAGHLAQPSDDPRHAMVRPVQRDRRRERLSDRPQGSRGQPAYQRLAMVAAGHSARHLSLLCHGRDHCQRRLMECQHRGRGGELGVDQAYRARRWRLYC